MSEDSTSEFDGRFAANMQRLREVNGWSKAEFVRILNDAGWTQAHQTTITRLESGQRSPRLGEAQLIARSFGQSIEAMMRPIAVATIEDDLAAWGDAVRKAYNRLVIETAEFVSSRDTLEAVVEEAESELAKRGNIDQTNGAGLELSIRNAKELARLTLDQARETALSAHEEGHHIPDNESRYLLEAGWPGILI